MGHHLCTRDSEQDILFEFPLCPTYHTWIHVLWTGVLSHTSVTCHHSLPQEQEAVISASIPTLGLPFGVFPLHRQRPLTSKDHWALDLSSLPLDPGPEWKIRIASRKHHTGPKSLRPDGEGQVQVFCCPISCYIRDSVGSLSKTSWDVLPLS